MFLFLLVTVSFSANANIICREYIVSGDLDVAQICVIETPDGRLINPELMADNGSWQISKGFLPKKRANKVCQALGFNKAIFYEVNNCLQGKVPTNMKGNYSTSVFPSLGTGACITEVACE